MIEYVQTLIERILKLGQDEHLDFFDQLRLRVFNIVLLMMAFAAAIMVIGDLWAGNETVYYSAFGLIFILFLFVLVGYKLHEGALLMFCTLVPLGLFFISIFYGIEMNINYSYFAFILVVLLSFKKNITKVLLTIFIFSLQVIGIYYYRYYGSIIEKDIPLLDGLIFLILPSLGVGILVLKQVNALNGLYEKEKKTSLELERKNEALSSVIKQLEDKNHLLATIAHDLKGPASNFLNLSKNVSYLIRSGQVERLQRLAQGFEDSGYKLYYNITNLLNWVVSQRKGIVANKRSINLWFLIKEIMESLSEQIKLKNITIEVDIDTDHHLNTDRNIIKIILLNLLTNAIKYSYENGIVKIVVTSSEGFQHISVIDYGIGMDAIQLDKIKKHDLFSVQGTINESGHGIGLEICFYLAPYIDGEINILSQPGEGAKFTLIIPNVEVDHQKTKLRELSK
ncbi:MAG: HAMP domain-containing histidine kinase [Chitinophagales bacterium]|nr:HAMP domain-containing histidine kinase [Chitinophagales bacterium]